MAWWSSIFGAKSEGITPNANGPDVANPGDPDGLEIVPVESIENRSLPVSAPSAWDGWPADWGTAWTTGQVNAAMNKLVDIAWACLDLNSNIISSMPVYRLKNNRIIEPARWMTNPDPDIYNCWQEFAKQLFWDYMMGEAFVMSMAKDVTTDKPSRLRVIPPWLVNVELEGGRRVYTLGSVDVTDRMLHIRYQTNTADARGHGPLEVAGAKQTQIRLLQRYANNMAETGGVPLYWLGVERRLTKSEANDLLETWIETRAKHTGHPAVLGSGASLNQARTMDAKEMGLLEISQFSESRIAILLGVPPFLVGLAGASGSLTYSNIADLFDFHDRSSLRPKVRMVMESMSNRCLVSNESAELNRDDYTRLPFDQRMQAYKTAIELDILTPDEVRIMERFYGERASQALTGGTD